MIKNDEQRGNVHAGDCGELHRSEIQRRSIAGQQRVAEKVECNPEVRGRVMEGDTYDRISHASRMVAVSTKRKTCMLSCLQAL